MRIAAAYIACVLLLTVSWSWETRGGEIIGPEPPQKHSPGDEIPHRIPKPADPNQGQNRSAADSVVAPGSLAPSPTRTVMPEQAARIKA
jgi:hypothetical protein